ncbi:MAG: hypothetical protein ACR2FP_05905, partial [Nocardioidaceae bacterium]
MHTLKKTVISVVAVTALAGGGLASPQIVSALGDDNSRSRHGETEPGDDHGGASGLDSARDRAERKDANGRHIEPGDDQGGASGLDSARDRAERKDANGPHIEPGDDRGGEREAGDDGRGELEPGDDNGGFDENSGHGGGDDN